MNNFEHTEPETPTYVIAEELGRAQEISDQEYYHFALEEWDKIPKNRIAILKSLFAEEPWKGSLKESVDIIHPSNQEESQSMREDKESLRWISSLIERGEVARAL